MAALSNAPPCQIFILDSQKFSILLNKKIAMILRLYKPQAALQHLISKAEQDHMFPDGTKGGTMEKQLIACIHSLCQTKRYLESFLDADHTPSPQRGPHKFY